MERGRLVPGAAPGGLETLDKLISDVRTSRGGIYLDSDKTAGSPMTSPKKKRTRTCQGERVAQCTLSTNVCP